MQFTFIEILYLIINDKNGKSIEKRWREGFDFINIACGDEKEIFIFFDFFDFIIFMHIKEFIIL